MTRWWPVDAAATWGPSWANIRDNLVADVIWAVFVVGLGGYLLARLRPSRRPSGRGSPTLTEADRGRLLNQVRARSSGQLDDLCVLPGGFADLRLDPSLGLVSGLKRGEPVQDSGERGIVDAYDAAHGRLLICGEPGSGKTVLIYRLIAELLDRCEHNPNDPLPLIVNLAAWAPEKSFREWLIDHLCDRVAGYGIGDVDLATDLVDTHRFALILDGLDELSAPCRAKCRDAINEWVATLPDPPSAPVVVTCRTAEYRTLIADQRDGGRLRLLAARQACPLTHDTIIHNVDLLARGSATAAPNAAWAAIRQALEDHSPAFLIDVLSSPLLFGLAAHPGLNPIPLLIQRDSDAATVHILRQFYNHATAAQPCLVDPDDARRWLGWVAWFNPRRAE